MYLLSTEEGVLYFVPNIFAFITGQKYQKKKYVRMRNPCFYYENIKR